MGIIDFRDSWEVWRRKVNEALGGGTEKIPATRISYKNNTSGLTANNVQTAIDEVAGDIGIVSDVANSKLQYIAVQEDTNIFDLMDNAEGSRIYVGYATKFTNGTSTIKDLLSISQYARVEIFNWNKYLAVIRIVNTDGIFFMGYAGDSLSVLNLMKVTADGNSVVTISKTV